MRWKRNNSHQPGVIIIFFFAFLFLLFSCSRDKNLSEFGFESFKYYKFRISGKAEKPNTKGEEKNKGNDLESDKEGCEEFESGGTEGEAFWKGWRKWQGKRPDFELGTSRFPFEISLEFYPVWEFGQEEPNSPDGFLVVHIANFQENVSAQIKVYIEAQRCVRIYGENEVVFSVVGVESFYVALKIKGRGDFWVSVYAQLENTPIITKESIVIVKRSRREIFGVRVGDYYLKSIYEEMIEEAKKREGAEYYKPSQIAIYAEEQAENPPDPIELELPSAEEIGVFAPPEEGVDVEYEETGAGPESWEIQLEPHSTEHYTFRGYVAFWDPYGKRYLAPYGAGVYVYDEDELSADDFICSATVREDGYFECSGKAYDFLSRPDPYVYIVPRNSVLEVRDCMVKDQYFRVVLKEFGPQGSGIKEAGTEENPVVIPDIFRAPYWIFRAIYTSWVRNFDAVWGLEMGNYEVCYPSYESYYNSSDRKIYVGEREAHSPSEVVKLFGFALMHKLYEYKTEFPKSLFASFQCWNSFITPAGGVNTPEAKEWAFKRGFAYALALYTFDTSKYCLLGEPHPTKDTCQGFIDLEGSTSLSEPYLPHQQDFKKWIRHFCDEYFSIFGLREKMFLGYSWEYPGYVASAIWDLYDDMTEADKNLWTVCEWSEERYEYVLKSDKRTPCEVCQFHRIEGRYPCDELKMEWGDFLLTLYNYKPKDYVDFAFKLNSFIGVDEKLKEKIDRVSKFNGIEFLPKIPIQVEIDLKKRATPASLVKIISLSWYDCSGVETEFKIFSDVIISIPFPSGANNQETFTTLDVSCVLRSYDLDHMMMRYCLTGLEGITVTKLQEQMILVGQEKHRSTLFARQINFHWLILIYLVSIQTLFFLMLLGAMMKMVLYGYIIGIVDTMCQIQFLIR